MSKNKKRLDKNQMCLFDSTIDQYISLKTEILSPPKPKRGAHSWEEECVEVAVAIKRAIKESGLSRDQVVDAVNEYYGWGNEITDSRFEISEDKKTKKALSIHIFNHYLSKPYEYPIPAYLIFAIQKITGSLTPCRVFAEAEDAQVISGDEKRALTLGKLDETITEMQMLKKELRVRRR
jgi:hypothetical protein